ncbi:MAG: cupin domain-containing protein [Candidatus Thorarchaeota archaeon]|nr:MAG: cupin domain-containing protein [Candidatus Thorarchaeota archaeon]
MLIRRLNGLKTIKALDNTRVREILNPLHDSHSLSLGYSLAHAALKPNQRSLQHRFHEASEVYYVLGGRGMMHIDDEVVEVSIGDTIYIPPMSVQWIESMGPDDLEFLCVVDPAWKPDAEELV